MSLDCFSFCSATDLMPALIAHLILEMNTTDTMEILAITQACIIGTLRYGTARL